MDRALDLVGRYCPILPFSPYLEFALLEIFIIVCAAVVAWQFVLWPLTLRLTCEYRIRDGGVEVVLLGAYVARRVEGTEIESVDVVPSRLASIFSLRNRWMTRLTGPVVVITTIQAEWLVISPGAPGAFAERIRALKNPGESR